MIYEELLRKLKYAAQGGRDVHREDLINALNVAINEIERAPDYQKLLRKYIVHVGNEEGVSQIRHITITSRVREVGDGS